MVCHGMGTVEIIAGYYAEVPGCDLRVERESEEAKTYCGGGGNQIIRTFQLF